MFTIITNSLWINKKNTDAISWKGPLEKRLQGILCIGIKSPNLVSMLTMQWFRIIWLGNSNIVSITHTHTHTHMNFSPCVVVCRWKDLSSSLLWGLIDPFGPMDPLKTISHIWVSVSHFKLMECSCSIETLRERRGKASSLQSILR